MLQSFDWSESSLIVEVITRNWGRVALIAKGAKKPSSNFRPILLPLQALELSYAGDTEIRTLKSAVWGGGKVMPKGEALLSGFYINELMLRLLVRDDPNPNLFDMYAKTVEILATQDESVIAPTLRSFELLLLKSLGWLPDFAHQTLTLERLQDAQYYDWSPEHGLVEAAGEANPSGPSASAKTPPSGLCGAVWREIGEALNLAPQIGGVISYCAQLSQYNRQSLQSQLRAVLHYHCGVSKLRTRQFMMDFQSL